MRKLILATQNKGKIAEFERLLAEHASDIKVLGLADFPDMPDVAETGQTLSENAFLKARAIANFAKLPALAQILMPTPVLVALLTLYIRQNLNPINY